MAARREPDYEADPLERLERNERSTREAVRYGLVSALLVIAFVSILAAVIGFDAGAGFTTKRLEVLLPPLLLAIALALGASWQTYRRWQRHIRWRPWLWLTQLMWIGATGYMLLVGSALVAQPPQV